MVTRKSHLNSTVLQSARPTAIWLIPPGVYLGYSMISWGSPDLWTLKLDMQMLTYVYYIALATTTTKSVVTVLVLAKAFFSYIFGSMKAS